MIKLYDYFRSSASYRVRIALELKNIPYELIEVHLVKNGGEQFFDEYASLNQMQRVPTLVNGDFILTQSMAILHYLDCQYPKPPLLPKDFKQSAEILSFAQLIACDIHPLNNLSVLKYLENNFNCNNSEKIKWYQHWINNGFKVIEQKLEKTHGLYSFGNEVTFADLCLIPQVYNAIRFEVDLTKYPLIKSINDNCNQLQAFIKASPEYAEQNKTTQHLT